MARFEGVSLLPGPLSGALMNGRGFELLQGPRSRRPGHGSWERRTRSRSVAALAGSPEGAWPSPPGGPSRGSAASCPRYTWGNAGLWNSGSPPMLDFWTLH